MGDIYGHEYEAVRENEAGEIEYYIAEYGGWLTECEIMGYTIDDENRQHQEEDDDDGV